MSFGSFMDTLKIFLGRNWKYAREQRWIFGDAHADAIMADFEQRDRYLPNLR